MPELEKIWHGRRKDIVLALVEQHEEEIRTMRNPDEFNDESISPNGFPVQEDYSRREPIKQFRTYNGDPVEQWADEKWYFWNEVWTDAYGPYDSEQDARDALKIYCKSI